MSKIKKYRIISEYTSYSKKKGAYTKRHIVEKNIGSLEEAIRISKEKYNNKLGELKWRVSAMLAPTIYEIK